MGVKQQSLHEQESSGDPAEVPLCILQMQRNRKKKAGMGECLRAVTLSTEKNLEEQVSKQPGEMPRVVSQS